MKVTKERVPEIGTKEYVRFFEKDQKEWGTEVAIYNLVWLLSTDMLKKVGVKNIKTTNKKRKRIE